MNTDGQELFSVIGWHFAVLGSVPRPTDARMIQCNVYLQVLVSLSEF